MRDLAYKAIQVKDRVFKETQKEATIEEIAKELNVEKEDIIVSLDAIQDPISLQEPVYNESSENLYSFFIIKDERNINMSKYKVLISGINTSGLKVLKQEEMEVLFKRMKQGDKLAREELINGNLKLVLSILKKFKTYNENLDDLFQIGCIGLVKAIDNFDPSLNVKFSTYRGTNDNWRNKKTLKRQ